MVRTYEIRNLINLRFFPSASHCEAVEVEGLTVMGWLPGKENIYDK